MTTDREVMQQALEALDSCDAEHPSDGGRQWYDERLVEPAIAALRARLAEPETCKPALQVEAEPVAWINDNLDTEFSHKPWMSKAWTPLYPAPPARRPLTDEEMRGLCRRAGLEAYYPRDGAVQYEYERRLDAFARAIERAHKIGVNDD